MRHLLAALIFVTAFSSVARAGQAIERTDSLEHLFAAVNGSVVLVRTWERMVVARDGIGLVPVTDLGSGVLISADGDVLTAAHLVQAADLVRVEFADGTTVGATVVASEPAADLALLQLDEVPAHAIVASMGDSDMIRVGQPIFVIGAPYGLGHTLTAGHISARHRPGTRGSTFVLGEFLQTDAAINRGNSGGPLFNMNGEVVGIVSHILSRSGAFEGVGFAVASNSIDELLLAQPSPWSGITVFGLDPTLAAILNVPHAAGLLVQRVAKGSPGARLGLLPGYMPSKIGGRDITLGGDVILEVDGIAVGNRDTYLPLRRHLAEMEEGHTIVVKILRRGQEIELSTVFGE
jgi:S1-C subfamily serine protease